MFQESNDFRGRQDGRVRVWRMIERGFWVLDLVLLSLGAGKIQLTLYELMDQCTNNRQGYKPFVGWPERAKFYTRAATEGRVESLKYQSCGSGRALQQKRGLIMESQQYQTLSTMKQDLRKQLSVPYESVCLVCCPTHPQWERLKGNVVREMERMKKDATRELCKQTFTKTSGALERLVRFVIDNQDQFDCRHDGMYKSFQQSTGFSAFELDNYAEDLHIFLAKKQYELDIMLAQMKSLNKTVMESLKNDRPSKKIEEPPQEMEITYSKKQETQFPLPFSIPMIPLQFNISPYPPPILPIAYPPPIFYGYELWDSLYFFRTS